MSWEERPQGGRARYRSFVESAPATSFGPAEPVDPWQQGPRRFQSETVAADGSIAVDAPEATDFWPHRHPFPAERDSEPAKAREASSAVRRRESIQRWLLAASDLLSAALALTISVELLGDDALHVLSLLALPLVVVVSKAVGLYDRDGLVVRKSTLDEVPKLFQLAALYALTTWLFENLLIDGQLGQRQVLGTWAMLFLLAFGGRELARALARRLTAEERWLVAGDGAPARRLRQKLPSQGINARIVGVVPLGDDAGSVSNQMLGDMIEELRVERVVIAPRNIDSEEVLEVIRLVKAAGVRVNLCPRLLEVVGSSVESEDVQGVPLLGVPTFRLSRSSLLLKRAFDISIAGFGLVVLSPLLLLTALAVKLDSPGPVLFRQRRVGLEGGEFDMLKFRTMVADAEARKAELYDRNEAVGLFKIEDDPRVTRVGRLLRSSSADELPQLWNVLRGEMSLVGPRPLVIDEDRFITGWNRERLSLLPGMTGHWQTLGSSRVPLHEMVKIDYLYVANWSLWVDVKLLLRTLPLVVGRSGR